MDRLIIIRCKDVEAVLELRVRELDDREKNIAARSGEMRYCVIGAVLVSFTLF